MKRWRPWLWRHRFVLTAALAAITIFAAVEHFRPPPPGTPIMVALRDIPAGVQLSPADVAPQPRIVVPGGVVDDPVGSTSAVLIPIGLPIVESMLVGPGLSGSAPPGTVIAPVRVADPAVLSLLRVGDIVDLYLSNTDRGLTETGSELIASGVRVVALPGEEVKSGGLLPQPHGQEPTTFVGAIAEIDAGALAGASGLAPFRVVLTG